MSESLPTPRAALDLLNQAAGQLALTRADHARLLDAANILDGVIREHCEKPATATEEPTP